MDSTDSRLDRLLTLSSGRTLRDRVIPAEEIGAHVSKRDVWGRSDCLSSHELYIATVVSTLSELVTGSRSSTRDSALMAGIPLALEVLWKKREIRRRSHTRAEVTEQRRSRSRQQRAGRPNPSSAVAGTGRNFEAIEYLPDILVTVGAVLSPAC